MSGVDLRVDWCSYQAAKWAVEHWHYSRSLPAGRRVYCGAWENDNFIGAVIFAWGAAKDLSTSVGVGYTQCCELCRVALTSHRSAASQIISKTIKMLKAQSPGLRVVVSFADPAHGHNGGVYQAMNWVYVGDTKPDREYFVRGKWVHHRQGNSLLGSVAGLPSRPTIPKHKYLYPLDRAMRKQIEPLRKPYPKRETCGPSVEGDTLPQAESQVRSLGAAQEQVKHGD